MGGDARPSNMLQSKVNPPTWSQQGVETGSHHHGRQDERQGGRYLQERLAGEPETGKEIGRRQAYHQGQQGREGRLSHGELQRAPDVSQVHLAPGKSLPWRKYQPEDRQQRVEEKHPQEQQRKQP